MAVAQPSSPAFGTANLSNYEREQIHLAGSIQPHGALLVVGASDPIIVQASDNAAAYLDRSKLQGLRLRALGGTLWERASGRLPDSLKTILPRRCTVGTRNEPCTALLHRAPDGELVIEIGRTEAVTDFPDILESAVRSIVVSTNLQSLCDESERIFRKSTGYDRVMVYRFDDAGHGEVFSETKRPELAALLGNRYPASDIPQMARRLYERNRVRLLADVDYSPPRCGPGALRFRERTRHVAVLLAQCFTDPSSVP